MVKPVDNVIGRRMRQDVTMTTLTGRLTPDEAGLVFVTPEAYANEASFHEACRVLREEDPIHLVEHPDFMPFHVLTKHADVLEVELHNKEWANAPRPVVTTWAGEQHRLQHGELLRTLIHMDDPEHREFRAMTADWFLPKNLAKLEGRLAELAKRSVDKMAELGGQCDFARDIAMPFPLQVILSILGLPESDYPRMLQLTQELFGASDEELSRGRTVEDLASVVQDFFEYFTKLTEDRRKHPTDDLASVIANATLHGEPIGMMETISYYVIIATAGHDTTSSAMAGGIHALVEHPDQLQRLREDPSLIPTAVDEIIRWVTPVKHFMRNCTTPYELRGHRFEPGDMVMLSYPSANRDEEVFEDPFRFDVGRHPNKHLAFGFGVHYCLGAMLARMEIKALLTELVPRLREIELAGEPRYMQTLFVGGPKSIPIRYVVD
jgi:cytochrome P450